MALGGAFFAGLRELLLPLDARFQAPEGLRPAGVLVPLTARPAAGPAVVFPPGPPASERRGAEIAVILGRRTERVPHHKGQICLPGGSLDPGDRDLLATALRETEEELGLTETDVDLLGTLEPVPTVTGFFIQPFVARLREPVTFRLDAFEMAEVFEAPLALFADERLYRFAEADFLGRPYRVWFIDWGRHTVWGATAMILRRLAGLAASLPSGFDIVPLRPVT